MGVKSFFMPMFEPLAMIWLVMVLSLGWLLWRKQWRSSIWLGIPTFLMFLIGSTPLAEALVSASERPWAAFSAEALTQRFAERPALDAVVVLGGGCDLSEHDTYGFALNAGGSRIVTGVHLVRLNKARNLVLGGSIPVEDVPGALVMDRVGRWVDAWRVVTVPVMDLGACRNTHEEAVAFKRLHTEKRWKQVALVTSALHMRRSAAAFAKEGIEVTPVACDFQACGVPPFRFSIFPRQERFRLLSLYLHEKIGLMYYRVRGWA